MKQNFLYQLFCIYSKNLFINESWIHFLIDDDFSELVIFISFENKKEGLATKKEKEKWGTSSVFAFARLKVKHDFWN